MDECRITVFFEDPFWVGAMERLTDGKLEAAKVTFGAEPKDYEIYSYFLKNWKRLRFSPPVANQKIEKAKINPKRLQRLINGQLSQSGIGTKAQQALKLQQEQGKLERKSFYRKRSEEEGQRRFALRQKKKKEKHRGR
ncbi:YjdF family protein [Caproiciproducens galactitolivorans]|uniref:YjdF family protein n=1 Tax=Caproiciproducens galactitolivorans TaxID=642589 RepID=A0ABT4BUJ6_9FIRM|nr:YjdF family protein [Caproiciproducens galactitolivorans]MCY1714577.1 YjdF family protein [Caproiciproducens galactitolivorans]